MATQNQRNILLVANWESNVGYAWWLMENFWVAIAKHFESQGQHCTLIYPKITTLPASIQNSNITTAEIDFADHSFSNIVRIKRLIKQQNIAYIYLSDSPSYHWFYVALRFFGIKKIVVHDHTPGDRSLSSPWLGIIKRFIQHIPYFTADQFIAVTDFVRQRHINVTCIPEHKTAVAANGITPINLTNIDPSYANKQFNIASDKTIVITTGRASYYKGIDFFIACANELVNNQKLNLHFIFCGDGPDIDAFKTLCAQYKLDNAFTFAGKRTDVIDILPSCDIGFHAAEGEVGYSLSILEYMSAGLATIVPDKPSTRNATIDGINGLIYKHRDLESACNAIIKCMQQEMKNRLRDNAIQCVKQEYTIDKTNASLLATLDKVFN